MGTSDTGDSSNGGGQREAGGMSVTSERQSFHYGDSLCTHIFLPPVVHQVNLGN